MKALTVREPWGFALIEGGKNVENRTWTTAYRGPLAIHTAARIDDAYIRDAMTGPYWDPGLLAEFEQSGRPITLQAGTFLGVVTLTDVHHATDCAHQVDGRTEYCSGWAMPGQWHWQVTDPGKLGHPLPAKGRLQLWDPTAEDVTHLTGCLHRWACIRDPHDRTEVHVVPIRDAIVHKVADDCLCGPTRTVAREDRPDGWLLTHHSLDGRESSEHTPTVRGCRNG